MNILAIAADLKKDESCTEFYSKYFSKRFSIFVSAFFIKIGVTPNAVTYLMLFVGLFSAVLFTFNRPFLSIVGALLLVTINLFDTCDGEMARYTQKCSRFGTYLDKIVHVLTNICLYLSLSFSFYQQYGTEILIYIGVLMAFLSTLDDLSKEVFVSLSKENNTSKIKKEKISFSKTKLKLLFHSLVGIVGFYHLLWVAMVIDIFTGTHLSIIYLYVHFAFVCYRFFIRQFKICKALN